MKKLFSPPTTHLTYWGLCLMASTPVYSSEADFARCAQQFAQQAEARLQCYDQISIAASSASAAPVVPTTPPDTSAPAPLPKVDEESASPSTRSYLTRVWNLDDLNSLDESKLGRLRPHRQNYLILRKSSNTNNLPSTPTAGHTALTPIDMDALEAKFLLSFKADIGSQSDIDIWGFKTFRVWGAYTQQSNWQIFNGRNSSPFRETNYEPEVIATFGTQKDNGLKLVNVGFAHQSNGNTLPLSRSWNRLYVQGGWEFNNSTSILARGWWRLPEKTLSDDNPNLTSYVGLGDVVVRWEPMTKLQAVSLLWRNNFRIGSNRNFMQLDWSTPVAFGDAARMYVQLTSGYGESLIDYNHKQTTLGFGFSFREW
ncbi:MAG: phospholipase A [Gallionella sp.]